MSPTPKQEKLAEVIIENALSDKPLNKKAMLEKVGYATNVAESKATEIIESEGVQEALEAVSKTMQQAMEKQGITKDYLAVRLGALLASDNPKALSSGLGHAFKLTGDYAPEKSLNLNVNADARDLTKHKELKDKFEAELLKQYQDE